jgi:multidrug efflux pump subunit AcrA (membrane-fusion protein)
MSILPTRPLIALTLGAIVAFGMAGCKKGPSEEQGEEDNLPREPVPVRAFQARQSNLKPSIGIVGSLVAIPERTTSVSPQIAGWIQKVKIVEGDRVRTGEELLRLDPRMAEADLAKNQAVVKEKAAIVERLKRGPRSEEIEMARHDAHKAQITIQALSGEVAALKSLRASNEVSAVQFQKTESLLHAAEAECASVTAKLKLLQAGTRPEEIAEAEARLEASQAELASAKLNVELCKVISPLEGTITQLAARQGMYVDRTAALAMIVDLSQLFMQIRVPSAYLANVHVGAKVDVQVTSLPEKTYQGTIARIGGQADPATGDVDALALVSNQDGLLRPGLSCRGRLWLPELANVLAVPVAAVADHAGTSVVTVVRDGKAHEIEVKLGLKTEDQVQIVRGLSPGDWVITEGGYGLPDNCPVRVTTEPPEVEKVIPRK